MHQCQGKETQQAPGNAPEEQAQICLLSSHHPRHENPAVLPPYSRMPALACKHHLGYTEKLGATKSKK